MKGPPRSSNSNRISKERIMDEHLDERLDEHPIDPQQFCLERLEFDEGARTKSVPTPDQLPPRLSREQIVGGGAATGVLSPELQHSATLEAVFAQNEDLMARLKVSLRRLTQAEQEIDSLRRENRKLAGLKDSTAMTAMVIEEKEARWLERFRKLEQENLNLQEKTRTVIFLQDRVARFKKYQERIRTTVKPFVHQLKSFAESLAQEIQNLNSELALREHEIADLKASRLKKEEETQENLRRLMEQQTQLVHQFENERILLMDETTRLRARTAQLELENGRIEDLRRREDELTNLVVSLKREKETTYRESLENHSGLKIECGQLRGQNTVLQSQIEDLKVQAAALGGEKDRLSHHNSQMHEQLASLRLMWTEQGQEIEKLRAGGQALEKINCELSRQLNQFRQS
ncbi:MAG: hypothetical protein C5B49_11860 [Bdellovibrio sp.]|nr:MAG: hypothetical protein C5B49_11860 [Bdellovibrio sp.]